LLGNNLFNALFNRHLNSPTQIKVQNNGGIVSNLRKNPNNLCSLRLSQYKSVYNPTSLLPNFR
jgi:hypothetical protein